MVSVELVPGGLEPEELSYVVIAARHNGGWIFVKHRRRGGYELPAGHPEPGEDPADAAARELSEETGAIDFTLEPVTFYSVDAGQGKQYGRLFFAFVETLGTIGDRSEIEGLAVFRRMPRKISLPEVMTFLYRQATEYLRYNQY